MKRYYMHTLDGRPAFYSPEDKQIVFAERRDYWRDDYPLVVVRESVEEIRQDQRRTMAYRTRMGFKNVMEMDYVILSLTPGIIPWKPTPSKTKHTRARRTQTADRA